jgi:hypothetical protein
MMTKHIIMAFVSWLAVGSSTTELAGLVGNASGLNSTGAEFTKIGWTADNILSWKKHRERYLSAEGDYFDGDGGQ